MSQEKLDLARRWFEEVWNARRVETIDELLDDRSICFTDDGPLRGPRDFKEKMYEPFVAAFPDLKVEVEAMMTDGEDVVVRWTARGTHRGDALGFPACNEAVTFQGMTWLRGRDGKLAEGWQVSDIARVVGTLAARSASGTPAGG